MTNKNIFFIFHFFFKFRYYFYQNYSKATIDFSIENKQIMRVLTLSTRKLNKYVLTGVQWDRCNLSAVKYLTTRCLDYKIGIEYSGSEYSTF